MLIMIISQYWANGLKSWLVLVFMFENFYNTSKENKNGV